jgi:hypothetical protein
MIACISSLNTDLFFVELLIHYLCSEQTKGNLGAQSNGAEARRAMLAVPPKESCLAVFFVRVRVRGEGHDSHGLSGNTLPSPTCREHVADPSGRNRNACDGLGRDIELESEHRNGSGGLQRLLRDGVTKLRLPHHSRKHDNLYGHGACARNLLFCGDRVQHDGTRERIFERGI